MSNEVIDSGRGAMSAVTVTVYGRFAVLAPQILFSVINKMVVSCWNTTFDYCEVNPLLGFYLPARQDYYSLRYSQDSEVVIVNERELGIISTLIFLFVVLNSELLGINKNHYIQEMFELTVLQGKYDRLLSYAREQLSTEAFEFCQSYIK
ncbi:hypothetical protein KJU82_003993 [Salmonella enterica]|nr:hypothetical protein [Salmonella enterica]